MLCHPHAHSCRESVNEIRCQIPSLVDFDIKRLADTENYIQWEVNVYNTGPSTYAPRRGMYGGG